MNKITCICPGVRDMARSVAFYRDGLGFKMDCAGDSSRVCFFDTPGTKFEQNAMKIPSCRKLVFGGLPSIAAHYNRAVT